MLAATQHQRVQPGMRGIVRWHQPTPWCMRIEYADRNSEKSEVTTAMNTHRPMRAGEKRDRADVAGLLAVLPGLGREPARDREPDRDADEERDDDRRVAQWRALSSPWPRAGGMRASTGTFCGMKSSGAPGTL